MKKTLLNCITIPLSQRKKKHFALFLITFLVFNSVTTVFANSGIFESFAILKVNSTSNQYYNLQSTSGNPNFQGASLGSFPYGTSIKFAGGEVKTFKNGPDNITAATLYYRVYSISGGSFNPINLPFGSNLNSSDQSWTATSADIELSNTLSPGTYTIEVYTTADGNANGGNFTLFSTNGGSNYKATFIIIQKPLIAASTVTKVYDGTTAAGTATLGTVTGLVGSETLTITPTMITTYSSANIGAAYAATIQYALADGTNGGLASNYSMANLAINNAVITGLSEAASTDYRSQASGNLSAPATWQFDQGGGSYLAATLAPIGKNIVIQNGNNIIQDVDYIIASNRTFTINTGGSYVVVADKVLTITGAANFNGQSVTLQSNSITNGGAIGTITGTLSGASNVTVQRFTQAQRGYRTLGNPLNAAQPLSQLTDNFQITGLTSGSPTNFGTSVGNPSAFIYNPLAVSPISPLSRQNDASATNWDIGKGLYVFIRGNGNEGNNNSYTAGTVNGITQPGGISTITVDVNGTVNNGQVDVVVDYLNGADNYNLIGNPYPSPIDLSLVAMSDASTLASKYGTVYIYNPMIGASSNTVAVGGFQTITTSGNPSIVIPTMGAFYVLATAAKTIRFQENAKSTTAPTLGLFGTGTLFPRFRLTISSGSINYDDVQVGYNNLSSASGNDFYDGLKLNNAALDFYSLSSDSKRLAIDYRNIASTDIIPLGIQANVSNHYTISLSELTDLPNAQLILKDKLLHVTTTLTNVGDSYSFDITADTATKGNNRFEIGLLGNIVLPVKIADITAQLQSNSQVAVNWVSATELNADYYQVQRSTNGNTFTNIGKVAAKGASTYIYTDDVATLTAPTIYYRLQMVDKDGSKTFSKVVSCQLLVASKALSIYPNPVEATLFAQVTSSKSGKVTVVVTDMQGKQLRNQTAAVNAGVTALSVDASGLAAGSYVLVITNSDGEQQQQQFVKK